MITETLHNTELIKRITTEFLIRYKFNTNKKTRLVGAGQLWRVLKSKEMANDLLIREFPEF